MKCPHCGAENPDNGIFCTECNGWILASIYQLPPMPVKEAPAPTPPPAPKKPKRKVIVPTVAALCMVIFLIVLLLPGGEDPAPTTSGQLLNTAPSTTLPFTTAQPTSLPITDEPIGVIPAEFVQCNSYISPLDMDGSLGFIINDSSCGSGLPLSGTIQTISSQDGSRAACLTGENSLLYIRSDGSITLLAQNVTQFALSANGEGLAYTVENALYLYSATDGASVFIEQPMDTIGQLALSPDGQSVAYVLEGNPAVSSVQLQSIVKLYRNGELLYLGGFGYSPKLLGVANGGDWVYIQQNGQLKIADAAGTVTDLGEFSIAYEASDPTTSYMPILPSIFFSADQRQMLYYGSDGTYLSLDGQTGVKVSDSQLSPITPARTKTILLDGYIATCPYYDLQCKLYSSMEYTASEDIASKDYIFYSATVIHYLDEELTAQTLLGGIKSFWLDPSGSNLYYLLTEGTLYKMEGADVNSTHCFGANVDDFVVNSDGSKLYYRSNSSIWCANGKAHYLIIDKVLDQNPTLHTTEDDAFCYQLDGTLYFESGNPIATGTCWQADNGALYLRQENGTIYIVKSRQATVLFSPSEIIELD